jgi:integrase
MRITRDQAHALLGWFPLHTRDMAIFALATGLRKSNVAGLEWERVDLERRCCYIPGYQSKSGEPITVPLNDDAISVLSPFTPRAARGLAGRSKPRRPLRILQELGGCASLEMPCVTHTWTPAIWRNTPTGLY